MKRSTIVRIVAIVLAIILTGSLLVGALTSVPAYAVTQADIDALEDQRDAIRDRKNELQGEIDDLEEETVSATAQKTLLDKKIALTEEEIALVTEQIATYTDLIAQKTVEVYEKELEEEAQWDRYREYIRVMEENGTISYFEILFGAKSFSDFLDRVDMVSEIMSYEEQMYDDITAAKEATAAAKTELQGARDAEEAAKVELEEKQEQLETEVAEAAAFITQLEAEISTLESLYAEEQAAENRILAQITEAEEKLENQNNPPAAPSGGGGSGMFIWPSTSWTITSYFGWRWHPVLGREKYHSGTDIGAGYGTPVYAAASGTVSVSTYDSGYGNYVSINHGNGYKTLYAHMSTRYVSAGEYVSQGEVIGLVGSTGISTGPHLHYEMYYNGSRVDALDYY